MRFKGRMADLDGRLIEYEMELPDDSMMAREIQVGHIRDVSIAERTEDGYLVDPRNPRPAVSSNG